MDKENLGKKEIGRTTTCSCFSGRKSFLAIEPICWFCRFAGFDLNDDKLPERGVCRYPDEQKEWKKGENADEK